MRWQIKFTNIRQSMLKLKTHSGFHDYFDSGMSNSTNTVVYFEDGNLYLRLRTQFKQTMIHQHVLLRRENQSHIHFSTKKSVILMEHP
jgi:hypothetical protein